MPRSSFWRTSAVVAISVGLSVPVLGIAQPAGAAGRRDLVHTDPTASTCIKTAKTQNQLDECASKRLANAERQLESALRTEEEHFAKTLVAAAEERWLAFRSAECTLEASPYRGGTIYPLIYTTCEVVMTKARLAQLEKLIAQRPL
jgi:uncharacterized protein YecT (DUF1311 family)